MTQLFFSIISIRPGGPACNDESGFSVMLYGIPDPKNAQKEKEKTFKHTDVTENSLEVIGCYGKAFLKVFLNVWNSRQIRLTCWRHLEQQTHSHRCF